MTATEQYHRDQAADDNREAKIDAEHDAGMTLDECLEQLPTVKVENFPAGKPRVSSMDFTDFGLIQTYHKHTNTITHEPDGWANSDDCVYRVVETWYADKFEYATLYVLAGGAFCQVMRTDNLQAIYLILLNIWSFDPRFRLRHYQQHPEAKEQDEAESLIPY